MTVWRSDVCPCVDVSYQTVRLLIVFQLVSFFTMCNFARAQQVQCCNTRRDVQTQRLTFSSTSTMF